MSSRKRHCFDVGSIAHNVLRLAEVPHSRNFGFEQKLFAAFWQTAVGRRHGLLIKNLNHNGSG